MAVIALLSASIFVSICLDLCKYIHIEVLSGTSVFSCNNLPCGSFLRGPGGPNSISESYSMPPPYNPHPTIRKFSQFCLQNISRGNSLVVQWLRLHASTAGGAGSIPGRGTKIPHAARYGQKKKFLEFDYFFTAPTLAWAPTIFHLNCCYRLLVMTTRRHASPPPPHTPLALLLDLWQPSWDPDESQFKRINHHIKDGRGRGGKSWGSNGYLIPFFPSNVLLSHLE